MSSRAQFFAAGYGLSAIGVGALASTGQVSAVVLGAATFALGVSWALDTTNREPPLGAGVANAAMLGALAILVAPVLGGRASPVEAVASFLLVLTAVKSLAPKASRDWIQLGALSFFQLLAASALTVEPIFAFVFLAYLVVTPAMLVLLFLRRETESAGQAADLAPAPDASLLRSLGGMTFALFVWTVLIFIAFPRVGAGYFGNPLGAATGLSGFSDRVELGDVSALKLDDAVALRVLVPEGETSSGLAAYWRGAVLDRYDGRRWTRSTPGYRLLPRREPDGFLTGEVPAGDRVTRVEIIQEPMDTPTLFRAGRVLAVNGRFERLFLDGLGNFRATELGRGRIRYLLETAVGDEHIHPTESSRRVSGVDPRVSELARRIVQGRREPSARANALFTHLRSGYGYTLTPGNPGGADPLVHFLFDTKEGHCEYFATALAVMLRAAGIPSRLVNGYHGGEWNPYGDYYLIRQRDAHSWVEAYLDGAWRAFDPTPPSGLASGGALAQLSKIFDAYRTRWYRYVVNYGVGDQIQIALEIQGRSRGLRDRLRDWWSRETTDSAPGVGGKGPVLFVLFGAALLGALMWARRKKTAARSVPEAAGAYAAMLRFLERKGLSKSPAETAEDYLDRVREDLGPAAEPAAALADLYQRQRFSEASVGSSDGQRDLLLDVRARFPT